VVQMITAYTEEVDEIEESIARILGQIDLGTLKKNSVGIVTCHYDFIHSGFIEEMRKKLPFNLIGKTTFAGSNPQGQGMYSLALTVLSSDELAFETAMTGPLDTGNCREEIGAAYSDALRKLPRDPSLIVTLFPNIRNLSGATIHQVFDETCGGIPFWGGVATHTDTNYDYCHTFNNGNHQKDCLAMLLIHGPIDPEFVVITMPLQSINKNQGKVTRSNDCVINEINGVPAQKYLKESLGITLVRNSPLITPIIVYYEDTTEPVTLAISAIDDDGSISCGGKVPEGSSVTIGEISAESIMASAREGMDMALNCGRRNGVMLLPCVSRPIMLEPDHEGELNLIAGKVGKGRIMPYMAAYSGGEICPVRDNAGVLRNRFHNFTFSACVF